MTGVVPSGGGAAGATGATPRPGRSDEARLRKAARQLEGVFTQQLFKAMRETVPTDGGVVSGGSAEEMFTGLLDEHLATDTRDAATRGIGEAIYRHLTRGLKGVVEQAGVTPGAPGASSAATPAKSAGTASA